jgi:signal transduction histidine kinase
MLLAMLGAASAQPKRVLLLNSFDRDSSPWAEVERGFQTELDRRSPEPVDVYKAALLTQRLGADRGEDPFASYLLSLYGNRSFDLVVAIGAPAARFVQRYRSQLFPSTPMLFTGVEQRRVPLTTLGENDTVVAISTDHASIVDNILRVLPETTDIAVVIGNSPNEQYWQEQIRSALQPYAKRVAFTWFNNLSFNDMVKRAASLPPKSAIFFQFLVVDAAGVSHEQAKAFDGLRAAANAPVFNDLDFHFGKGIVGGSLVSVGDVAQQSASAALRILSGEAPSGIKTPPVTRGTPRYDWRELQRWNISENLLPPQSEIHFRPPGLWEQYRWQLSTTFAILLLQAGMITWLLFERERRHRAELESRGRLLEVIHLNQSATAGVLSASFTHELNQPLGAILSNAETAELLLENHPLNVSELKEILADIRHSNLHAAEIINRLGGLLKKQTQVDLQELDLNESVSRAAKFVSREASRRDVVVDVSRAQGILPVRANSVHLQQVVLNLALNAMDAMQNIPASRKLTLETMLVGQTEVGVTVSDTGPGIPDDKLNSVFDTFYTTKPHGSGLGLSIARTIVEYYGGRIWAENQLPNGAVFRFTLPLARGQ